MVARSCGLYEGHFLKLSSVSARLQQKQIRVINQLRNQLFEQGLEWALGIEQIQRTSQHRKTKHTSKRWDDFVFLKNTKTKITALAKSIESKGGWTDFN